MTRPILYCGDPHGKFSHIVQAALDLDASAVILLGDLEPQRPMHIELEGILERVWFIHGNHDTDSKANWVNIWDSELAERNIDGRVVTLPDGTRIAGLGGVFRESVWYPTIPAEPKFRSRQEHASFTPKQDRWRNSVPLRHWSTIYPDEFEALSKLQADVLITHEAPGYHNQGFKSLNALARSVGAKVAVHGHHHDQLDSSDQWAAQGFKSYGVGLRGITAIDTQGNARVIVPGELDRERDQRQRYEDLFKDAA